MTSARADAIREDYAGNMFLLRRFVENITHDESMLTPPMPCNNLNWLVGHVVFRRNTALELLEADPVWDSTWSAVYQSGSEPVRAGGKVKDFRELVEDLEVCADRITSALDTMQDSDLEPERETDRGRKPIWQHLEGLHWHETFHLGQIEMLKDYIHAQRTT